MVEYRYSSHSRAAAGCGADLLDGLVVVGGVEASDGIDDLQALDARPDLGRQQVVRPDDDRRLAALDGRRAGVTGMKLPTACSFLK